MANSTKRTLIRGGRVYDHDGDPHHPAPADVLIEGDRIAKVEAGLAERLDPASLGRTIDARDKLVLPGFVNGHYHSHDTLLKGLLRDAAARDLGAQRAAPGLPEAQQGGGAGTHVIGRRRVPALAA